MSDPTQETVHLVELSALTDLARAGLAMRKAQQAFFDARASRPHASLKDELPAAKSAEARFDRAVKSALARERACLPGMEGGGS